MKKLIIILSVLVFSNSIFAQGQNVGINTLTPDPSAILEVYAQDKGVLIPRLTSSQRMAIVNPANSLMVYDTDMKNFYYFEASSAQWLYLTSSNSVNWAQNGNDIYNVNSGNVGIGTDAPEKKLHLKGDGIDDVGMVFTNADSTHSIIIEIDETNDGFELLTDNGLDRKSMMYFDENGKVGVGMRAPARKIHVQGDGDENVALAMTNADSTYSIIIEIDETNDGFRVLGDNGLEVKELMFIDSDGKMGMGTTNPQKKMHIKGDPSQNASIALTQADSSYNIIIEIDETNDGFQLIGDNGIQETLMYIDDQGKVGLGTTSPNSTLHIVTDYPEPSVKITKPGNPIEYNLGYEAGSNDFAIVRDTIAGGETSVLEFDSAGDVTINSSNEINLNSNTVNTTSISLENPVSGATAVLSSDLLGNLVYPGSTISASNILDFRIDSTLVQNTIVDLDYAGSSLANTVDIAATTIGSNSINILETGIYQVYVTLHISKLDDNEVTELLVSCLKNNVLYPDLTYETNLWDYIGNETISISRLSRFVAGDSIEFDIQIPNYYNTDNDVFILPNSYINLVKIAD